MSSLLLFGHIHFFADCFVQGDISRFAPTVGIDASVHVIFHVGVFHFVNQCLVIHFGPVLISQYSIDAESFVLEIDTGIPLEFG